MIAALLIGLLSFFNVHGANLKDQITSALMKTYSGYKSIEVEFTQTFGTYDSVVLSSTKSISVNNNIALVPVRFKNKGVLTEKYISVRVKFFEDVYVCVRDIIRNTQLKPEDYRIESVDVASFRKRPLDTTIPATGYKAKTNLRPGEIIFDENLMRMPVINNGDRITAKYDLNGVSVSFEAVARQNGAEGDCIVIISSDNKQFKAKVINNSTVEVME